MTESHDGVRVLFEAAVAQALSAGIDDEAYWTAVYALQGAPMDAVWPLVAPLADDARPALRAPVADVLRCVARREASLVPPTMSLLAARLRAETETSVLVSIFHALGELAQPARVGVALPFATHPDARVRQAVVHALSGARSADAMAASLRASTDESDGVRDWATFELGTQLGDDDDPTRDDVPGVLDALLARLEDAHRDTRGEAIVGRQSWGSACVAGAAARDRGRGRDVGARGGHDATGAGALRTATRDACSRRCGGRRVLG